MRVSTSRGPPNRLQYFVILIIRTSKGPQIVGNPPHSQDVFPFHFGSPAYEGSHGLSS